jgi:enolase-phosphatase E1
MLTSPRVGPTLGLLWRTGYETGSIKAPIYNDVLPAIQRWVDDGKKVVIYSSGSVAGMYIYTLYIGNWEYLLIQCSPEAPLQVHRHSAG